MDLRCHFKSLVLIMLSLVCNGGTCIGENMVSITNEVQFASDGSGRLCLYVAGSDFRSVARSLGFTGVALTNHSIDYDLGLACTNLHMKEISKNLVTNVSSFRLNYVCSFSKPSMVLDWFDDNIFVNDKYIRWSDKKVDLQLHLTEIYQQELTIVVEFQGYVIRCANDIIVNGPRISWRPKKAGATLSIEAERSE